MNKGMNEVNARGFDRLSFIVLRIIREVRKREEKERINHLTVSLQFSSVQFNLFLCLSVSLSEIRATFFTFYFHLKGITVLSVYSSERKLQVRHASYCY